MEVNHDEMLPVAGVFLPKALRAPVGVIYHVARTANDIATERELSRAERHARLADFRAGLDAVAAGETARVHPQLFASLAAVAAQYKLPLAPFYDLVSAFDQDIDAVRYADWPALLDYCRHSANPAGHLLLPLIDSATPENLCDADSICTALQLVNFWQDVKTDWEQGRVYLPLADLARFNVTDAQIAKGHVDAAWRALMADQVQRTRALLVLGAPLALRLPGRFGFEMCCVVHGGLRILERIESAGYDVFRQRPTLGFLDWCIVAARAVAMRLSRRVGVRAPSIEGNA